MILLERMKTMTNSEAIEYFYNKMSSGSIQNDYQQEVFEQAINALEENDKLKAENERLASDNSWLVLMKAEKEFENVDLLEERDKLKAEIEQLKSELEQSVNEKSEVISKIEYALNECEPIYNGCAFVPQAKPIYDLAMNYCLDLLKGQV